MLTRQRTSFHKHYDNTSDVESLSDLLAQPLDMKFHQANHHMELARLLVEEIIKEEPLGKAGERYSREGPLAAELRTGGVGLRQWT